jgi:hypothetical protein
MSNTPFDLGFVMSRTAENMLRAIDVSSNKTIVRISDFEPGHPKHQEILMTLSALSTLRKLVKDFQYHNPLLFEKE